MRHVSRVLKAAAFTLLSFSIFSSIAPISARGEAETLHPNRETRRVTTGEAEFLYGDSPQVTVNSQSPPIQPVVKTSLHNDTSSPLRRLAPTLPERQKPQAPQAIREIPFLPLPRAESELSGRRTDASIVQNEPMIPNAMPLADVSFEGVSNVNGVLPPDTEGDIGYDPDTGKKYYMQWNNLSYAIWDVTDPTDVIQLVGPVGGNTLWSGFGGICETHNDGDPIVLYDHLAERWMASQFALDFPNNFHQCIAISATGDPTGAWHRYDFQISTSKFNDYPKFGVWPDAYYMSINQFNGASINWAGAGAVAFERAEMLQGNPAQMVYFDLYGVNPGYGGQLPSDLDGTPPPDGTPNFFVEWDDSAAFGDPSDMLRIWEFHVDWTDPANSTFGVSGAPNATVSTTNVDPNMCGYSRNCIPQPGGTALDAISDRLMYRLQYRNLDGSHMLLSNHTVDVDGADHAGIHWFELRDSGGGWAMHQEGVYAPDSDHRWMGSIAMDKAGNMALGYSVSSASTYPSIRYAGRLADDPLGTLPQGETELVAGSGYQTSSSGRWGDYSMMGVDPDDDCTFWYTQEYYATVSNASWRTRIGAFKFPGCTVGLQGTLTGLVSDGSTGIPGAIIKSQSITQTLASVTDDSGVYTATLPVGVYDVTASAYGYYPQTVTGVQILSGTVNTQDFTLTSAPTYTLEGVVSDSNAGWPLYARVDVSGLGYPGAHLWTDPVTGYYSIDLSAGITYTLDVQAFSPGYLADSREVYVGGDITENIALEVDISSCNAPGYQLSVSGLLEQFDNETLPSGWAIVDNAGTGAVWRFDDPGGQGNLTGGDGNFAIVDSDYEGFVDIDTELRTPVLDFTGQSTVRLEFVTDFTSWLIDPAEIADVDVSDDNGGSWTNVWRKTQNDGDFNGHVVIDISAIAANQPDVVIRFHYYNAYWDYWWELDNVRTTSCDLLPGGLVVGNVYDANSSNPVIDALVSNEHGDTALAMPTPLDANVDEAFYTLFSPSASHPFTATMFSYGPDLNTVNVVAGSAVRQDFHLPAGLLEAAPTSMDVTLVMGQVLTQELTLANLGGYTATYKLRELDPGFAALGPFEKQDAMVKPFKQSRLTAEGLGLGELPQAPPYAAGNIIQSWPTSLDYGWGLGYSPLEGDLWIGNIAAAGGDDLDYRFLANGVNTGDTINTAPWAGAWAADMASDPNSGMLWQLDVGGGDCIHELDPDNMIATGNTICPGFAASQRGLAYDPTTDTFFAGGWNDLTIHQFTPDGDFIRQVDVGLATAGLAYNPDTQHLFVMVNDSPNQTIYILDAANPNFALLGQFTLSGFSDWGGAGLGIDCSGNLWAVDQVTQTAYQFESGETTSRCTFDLPWLNEAPISGTLAVTGDQAIDVVFDAGVPEVDQPGEYSGQILIAEDTPYKAIKIPVTMTVNAAIHGVEIAPPTGALADSPGTTVTYTLQVTNTGNIADSFDLSLSGNSWTSELSNASLALGPGLGTNVDVTVTIPQDALAGQSDSVTLTAASQADPSRTDSSVLTTTAEAVYGVEVAPPTSSLVGLPGTTVTYTLQVTNTGNAADTLDLNLSGNAWTTDLSDTSLALGPRAGADVDVMVDIPMEALASETDVVSLTAASQADPSRTDSSVLTTTVETVYGVEVAPPTASLPGEPGTTVTYTLQLTNTGNTADTFDLGLSGNTWASKLSDTSLALGPGAGAAVEVAVDIPIEALEGETDTVTVLAASQADPSKTDSSTLTTTVGAVYGVELAPPTASLLGAPGATVTYTLHVTNTGNAADTLNLNLSGNAWTTDLSDTSLALNPGVSATVEVAVDIPIDATDGEADSVTVLAASQADPFKTDSSILTTTTEAVYGVKIAPPTASRLDAPGATVTYTLQMTNTGNVADTFDLSLSGNTWNSELSDASLTLDPGAGAAVEVAVDIPADALAGETDAATLSAASQADPSRTDSSILATTTLAVYGVEIAPPTGALADSPGTTVTYTLQLTNTGNAADIFDLSLDGNTWTSELSDASLALDPGSGAAVEIAVDIPIDALEGEADSVTVLAASQADPSKTDSSILATTTEAVYGVEIAPPTASLLGAPGTTVTYTLQLTNTGNVPDTFDLGLSGNAWVTNLSDASLALDPGASAAVEVAVDIPADTLAGETDAAILTAASQADPSRMDSSNLITTAGVVYGVAVAPPTETGAGAPGETMVYTLVVTNTGNTADTFDLSLGGNDWTVDLSLSSVFLDPGIGVEVEVLVAIPGDALDGEMDGVTVTAASQADPSRAASSNLTTIAEVVSSEVRVYIPYVKK